MSDQLYTSNDGKKFSFNDHVCMEMMLGPFEQRTGRLVQVRKKSGAFGSDLYFLRLRDGTLITFENVLMRKVGDERFEFAFYKLNKRTPPVIPDQAPNDHDSTDAEYTIRGEWPEVGFVIEAPKQPNSPTQSFGMMIVKEGGL